MLQSINNTMVTHLLIVQKERNAFYGQRVRLPFQVGNDSIIWVGFNSILLCYIIYKFVTINMFNCHGTIAFM